MSILALNMKEREILTDQMLADITAAAEPACEVVRLAELPPARYDEVEIVFGAIPYDMATKLPNLKWLQLTTAGVDASNDFSHYPDDFRLTCASGAFGRGIAEHVVAMFLGFTRGLQLMRDQQAKKIWDNSFNPRQIYGSTVGVIGLGDLGHETAKRCHALGANVIAAKRRESLMPEYISRLYFDMEAGLDELIAASDYIALCLPLTAETQNIIDARRIDMLKPGSVLVNVGRGALIDQQALISRLQKGDIYAGLDVFTPEPLPEESPLWSLPNCWVTPHMAGMSWLELPNICGIFVDNLRRYFAGEELRNLIDPNAGY